MSSVLPTIQPTSDQFNLPLSVAPLQSITRSISIMKCVSAVLLLALASQLPLKSLAQVDHNYLISSYNYAVAIRHNFEEATEYYYSYFTEELEKISEILTERLAVAMEATAAGDVSAGYAINACAGIATHTIQAPLSRVHDEFLVLTTEGNQLHQAINQKMMEVNMLLLPMDEFYFKFTDRMFVVYMRLNDQILPDLMTEIVNLMVAGEEASDALEMCLNQIN